MSVGPVPRVLLRDTDGGPERRPGRSGLRHALPHRRRDRPGRHGLGPQGRDPDLGRDVALKVLREDLRDKVDMVRRFVEEAQIGGQLQHPGIVPIYELGTFDDRRPFFSMKLVKGDTLAKLLASRQNPADGLPRFLSIFESIAQTVAYAHARGVIHRDLKPSNVMVGSFGEVQVMDWGLAKVLPRGGIVDDATAGKIPKDETVIATARSGWGDSDLSRAGSILGTPAYMAPEQARGEIDRVNERADVFALGSILCEILTGEPAFVGRTSGEIQRKSALGDLADAFARLDASGADADLIALAKHCLAREPEDRPNAAGVVSDRVTAYLAGVQERLRRAEITERRGACPTPADRGDGGGCDPAGPTRRRRLRLEPAAKGRSAGEDRSGRRRGPGRRGATARRGTVGTAGRLGPVVGGGGGGEAGRGACWPMARPTPCSKSRVDTLMTEVERDRATAAEKARQIEIDRVLLSDLESVRGNRVAHRRDLRRADAGLRRSVPQGRARPRRDRRRAGG